MESLLVTLSDTLLLGIITSAIYVLISVGFTIVYGVGRILNLSHASYMLLAAYIYWFFTQGSLYFSLPKSLAFLLAVLVTVGVAITIYQVLVRHLLGKGIVIAISTFILALLIEAIIIQIFSMAPRTILPFFPGGVSVLGIYITFDRLTLIAISWIAILFVFLFINRTQVGRAIQAISINERGGILVGINPERIRLITWVLASALAGVGGILYAKFTLLSTSMWVFLLIMSFAVVIIGGLGSITGALIAAHIIGFMEAVEVTMIDPRLRGIFALILMILVLVFRPKGLLGRGG